MSLADELRKLQELRQSGGISEEEYASAKAHLLSAPQSSQFTRGPSMPIDVEQQTRQWALLLHLSQLVNYVVPFGGIVAPIVIWQVKKDELPALDEHGRNVVNWIISAVIYAIGSVILMFCVIGIVPLIALGIVGIVFPVIGAIKANNGEVWKYPLTISFIKPPVELPPSPLR